jgi:apolipoprotein D and lipocalin family protein
MRGKLWKPIRSVVIFSVLLMSASACSTNGNELATVDHVDIPRFMGRWYVIANIPTFLEKGAHNAVETYELDADGSIATTFTYRKDGFDGELKTYTPRGFVRDDPSNAIWGMRFIWPIKADYRIIYLESDYSVTIIGRNKRDFVWIMARQPALDDATYARLLKVVEEAGYDLDKIRRVPQKW